MPFTVNVTIEPSDKYREVILGELPKPGDYETQAGFEEASEYDDATEAYLETIENTPDPEEYGMEPEDHEVLTWDDISPSRDPDLLAKIATYFDGLEPDEPTERLRAKCRLLDVDLYVNAQIASRAELREAT